jgi:hypothetical protein
MMVRVWPVVLLAILLSGSGCDLRKGSKPVMMRAPQTQPATAEPVEPMSEPAVAAETPEETPVLPVAPADPLPPLSEPAAESTPFPAAPGELLHETFADAAGQVRWNRDGVKSSEGPPSNRTIYFFYGPAEASPLVMRVVEDNATSGPDGQPGVLAFSWQEVPPTLTYSGITFLGGRTSEDRLTLPPLQAAKSVDDLRPLRLKFRHKAVNDGRTEPFSLAIGCRLEPLLAESYSKRVDLGNFTATGEWGSFDMSLGEGTNAEALLAAIAGESPTSFKIIWAQGGPVAGYQAGDTLLIDDIVITNAAQPAASITAPE